MLPCMLKAFPGVAGASILLLHSTVAGPSSHSMPCVDGLSGLPGMLCPCPTEPVGIIAPTSPRNFPSVIIPRAEHQVLGFEGGSPIVVVVIVIIRLTCLACSS